MNKLQEKNSRLPPPTLPQKEQKQGKANKAKNYLSSLQWFKKMKLAAQNFEENEQFSHHMLA